MRRLFVFSPLLLLLLLLLPRSGTACLLRDGGTTYYFRTDDRPAEAAAAQLGLQLDAGDRVSEQTANGVRRILVERLQTVTVALPQGDFAVETYGESVGALLRRVPEAEGLAPACDPALPTFDGMRLELLQLRTYQAQRRELLPAATVRLESAALGAGETELLCAGADGEILETERITEKNGEIVERTTLARQLVSVPRTRIELYGVDRSILMRTTDAPDGGVVTASGGEVLRYRYVLQCEATAYTCEGVGTTATGTVARVGAIAVDPRYIPYGTRMYIVSNDGQYVYGYATAEDTGAFSGYRIDLYFDTEAACWEFGRRTCTVYVLD